MVLHHKKKPPQVVFLRCLVNCAKLCSREPAQINDFVEIWVIAPDKGLSARSDTIICER
jgi:hypothetical protein